MFATTARPVLHSPPQGQASEVSGGLLICLPREQAAAYCKDMERLEGSQSWIIGRREVSFYSSGQRIKWPTWLRVATPVQCAGIVEKGDRSARVIDKPRVIEVPSRETEGELW